MLTMRLALVFRAGKLMLRLPSTLSRSPKIGAAMPVMPCVTSPVVWSQPALRMRFKVSCTFASVSPSPAAANSRGCRSYNAAMVRAGMLARMMREAAPRSSGIVRPRS